MLCLLRLAKHDSLVARADCFFPPALVHSKIGHAAKVVGFVEPRNECSGMEPGYFAENSLCLFEILEASIATPHSGEGSRQEHWLRLDAQAPYQLHGHLRDPHPSSGILIGHAIPCLDEMAGEARIPVLGIVEDDLGLGEEIKLCE
jgi:hypothetical protein